MNALARQLIAKWFPAMVERLRGLEWIEFWVDGDMRDVPGITLERLFERGERLDHSTGFRGFGEWLGEHMGGSLTAARRIPPWLA